MYRPAVLIPCVGQETDQTELGGIRILILVYHDITKPLLIIKKRLRIRAEQLYGLEDQIVKIQGIICLKTLLVFLIDPGAAFSAIISRCPRHIFFRADQLVLGGRDSR